MAEHTVRMKTIRRGIEVDQKNPVTFAIMSDQSKLGALTVSKRFVTWTAKSRKSGRRMTWETFAKLMDEC